jgi:hypothetical protein
MQYMDLKNENHFKLFEIKMVWSLVPLPSPKELKNQILIVVELNKGEWGEKVTRGKNKHF